MANEAQDSNQTIHGDATCDGQIFQLSEATGVAGDAYSIGIGVVTLSIASVKQDIENSGRCGHHGHIGSERQVRLVYGCRRCGRMAATYSGVCRGQRRLFFPLMASVVQCAFPNGKGIEW